MTIEKAIKMLNAEYDRAKVTPYVRNPLAYALCQTWKVANREQPKEEE